MRISTISIGDELITGQVIDSNAATIARELLAIGLRLQHHRMVGDREPDIMEALQELSRNNDAVIVTGGLGPTADDLTARAAARATGRRLVVNEEARQHVRTMSSLLPSLLVCPLNDKQSLIPTKTTLIPNPAGTACGFYLMYNGCFYFFLPGVPSEMHIMLQETVLPFIGSRISTRKTILTAYLNLFGPAEAEVDELVNRTVQTGHGMRIGICVNYPWMRLTVQSEADQEAVAAERLATALVKLRGIVGEFIFSEGNVTFEEQLGHLFSESGLTVALAESCSGGMVAERLTSVPGSSRYFREGAVTYSNEAKQRQLGIDGATIATKGAVSSEVASSMAKGVRAAANSDLGLAVTGIAGPDGGTGEKPVGTVFISLAAPDGCWTKRFQFSGSRQQIRIMTTWTALDWLRRYLLSHQPDPAAAQ